MSAKREENPNSNLEKKENGFLVHEMKKKKKGKSKWVFLNHRVGVGGLERLEGYNFMM